MNINQTGGINPTWETIVEEEITGQNLNAKINEEQYNDSMASFKNNPNYLNIDSNTLSIPPPNQSLIQTESQAQFDPSTLTTQDVDKLLSQYPQFSAFLNAQNLMSENEVDSVVLNSMKNIPNPQSSASSIAATALAEQMYSVLKVDNNPQIQSLWESLRADILTTNQPLAQVLINSVKQNLIQQGTDPTQAANKAVTQTLNQLDVELSHNGVVTPYYGTHPEMPKAIEKLLTEQLGGSDTNVANFINQLKNMLSMQSGLVNAMNAVSAVSTGKSTEDLMNTQANKLNNAQSVINQAMSEIQKLPLPKSDQMALLAFLKEISSAIQQLREIMKQISLADMKQSKETTKTKFQIAETQCNAIIKKLEQQLKKIIEAEHKSGIFGALSGVFKGLGIAGFVISQLVVTLALPILAIGLATPLAPLVVPLLLGTLMVGAGSLTSFALAQSGEMDKMTNGLMGFLMGAASGILGHTVSEKVASYIGIGVLALGVALPVVSVALGMLLLPVGYVALMTFFPLIMAVSLLALTLLLPLTLMGMAIGAMAAVLMLTLTPLIMGVALQFAPELLMRSGLLGQIAQKIGGSLGMSQDQIDKLQAALRVIVSLPTLASGMSVSSHMSQVSAEDQSMIDQGIGIQRNIQFHKSQLYSGQFDIQPHLTLLQLAAEKNASPEETKKREAELEKLMVFLRKVIQQLEALLKAILSGGSPEAISQALADFKNMMKGYMKDLPTVGENGQTVNSKGYVDTFFDQMNMQIPNALPSEDALKNMFKMTEPQDTAGQGDTDMIRTSDIMG